MEENRVIQVKVYDINGDGSGQHIFDVEMTITPEHQLQANSVVPMDASNICMHLYPDNTYAIFYTLDGVRHVFPTKHKLRPKLIGFA